MPKPPAIAAPKGGAAIRGIGEKFAANPATGTLSATVPIGVTPGRAGFGPQLQLGYDSGAGNGPFGFGWSLPLPAITRKTDKGLPRYADADESDVFLLTNAEDLQPVLVDVAGEWERPPAGAGVADGVTFRVERYRPRTEGVFARIERWTDTASGDVHWRSTTRDNVTTVYGRTSASRIADPRDASRIFSWLISETFDDRGNAVVYEYFAEDSAGVDGSLTHERNRSVDGRSAARHLKFIRYGNRRSRLSAAPGDDPDWMFVVAFDYDDGHYADIAADAGVAAEAQHSYIRASERSTTAWRVRPDPFSSYRAGFELRTYRRCRRILMFHRFPELGPEPCLVRATAFDYDDLNAPAGIDAELAHPGSTGFASFIKRIVQTNFVRDDTHGPLVVNGVAQQAYLKKEMPPLELEYSKARIDDRLRELDAASLEHLPAGLESGSYQWADLNGDGMPGVLVEQAHGWFYKPNLGDGRLGALQPVGSYPAVIGADNAGVQLLDLAGDGRLDLVAFNGPTAGFYERTPDEGWEPFRPFAQTAAIDWNDRNVRMVDLDGDGHADILVTQDDMVTWYPSLAERGFDSPRRVSWAGDEEAGPRLVFADGSDSIYLADMSGDGLSDLVRIRNGDICYWPNIGYGRFGAKVTMDGAPWFDHPDQFDQRRVRLTDIDGSGVSDVIYLGHDGARLYFNRSGNSWSGDRSLAPFPRVDDFANADAVDLLGNGTSCLVWSSPVPASSPRPLRYVDLMGGRKPHLLVGVRNNLGAETRVHYLASTHFSAADAQAGHPWVTQLPFPVHVVNRIETFDFIARNRFVSRRAYHHGYFDGEEREFRGFAMVEQWDTEELASLTASGDFPSGDNVDASSAVPPVYTRTWFHTGAHLEGGHLSRYFAGLLDGQDHGEYYREPGLTDAAAAGLLLDDASLPGGLSAAEEREAVRALRGVMLREEIYAQDGSPFAPHPYSVTEQCYAVEVKQRRGPNRHGVFFTHQRETLVYQYERDPTDPRVTHTLTLAVDDFGNVLQEATIGYGRRAPDTSLAAGDQTVQAATRFTCTEHTLTNLVDTADAYRTPLQADTRTYEVSGGSPVAPGARFDFDEVRARVAAALPLSYEQAPAPPALQKRLIEHVRTFYRRDDLAGMLPLGVVESRALVATTHTLALTPGLVTAAYGTWVTPAMLAEAGYVHSEGDAQWWVPTGHVGLSPDTDDTGAQELAYARAHFFLPHRFRDPFHTPAFSTETHVVYDAHELLPLEVVDAAGNRTTVGERAADGSVLPGYDYRVMQPRCVTDPNGNRTEVLFDARAQVVATAVRGQRAPALPEGDELTGVVADLTDQDIAAHLSSPPASALALLGRATTRLVYDVFAYYRTRGDARPSPVCASVVARESHHHNPVPAVLRLQHSLSFSDGFGREIQRKLQAEPGPVPVRDASGAIVFDSDGQPLLTETDASPRWVASGWTILNNKGKPVRQFEPFFTDRHRFEFDVRAGVSAVLFYDPVERVVGTLHPNRTWEKVVIGAWKQEAWDGNDTVLIGLPQTDATVGDFFARVPSAAYLPTWYDARQGGALGVEEQRAAVQTAVHAGTPTVLHADSLGRTFLAIAHQRAKYSNTPPAAPPIEGHYHSRTVIDIEGNKRRVTDPLGRLAVRDDYDMMSNIVRHASMDAGERWMLTDVAGKILYSRDSRGHQVRTSFDALRRPVASHLSTGGGAERTVGRLVYGESLPAAEIGNRRGKVVETNDQSGTTTVERFDFKGNALVTHRQVAVDYKSVLDWSAPVALSPVVYTTTTRYDAVNRPVQTVAPHANTPGTPVNVIQPVYNEANLLERIDVWDDQVAEPSDLLLPASAGLHAVTDITYNARGERVRIAYGNGVTTAYTHDPFTFRLRRLHTTRGATFAGDCPQPPPAAWPGCGVQDLHYTYDPIGNVVSAKDDAQQRVFFQNRRVDPTAEYTYDSLYRLIEATGREHLGQLAPPPAPPSYNDRLRIGIDFSAADGNAVGRYLERYVYDEVGKFLEMQHVGTAPSHPGWTRSYVYADASALEPAIDGNRLTRTSVGASPPEVYSAGGSGYDAHGNMLRMPHLERLEWDYRDQLRLTERQAVDANDVDGTAHHGERTWYVHGASGDRVRKVTETAGGTVREERLYLGGFEVYRRHGTNAVTRETLHVMDDRRRVVTIDRRTDVAPHDTHVRFQHAERLGSTVLELDEAGALVSYEEYTPYGATTFAAVDGQTHAPKRYRYVDKERDEETGFYAFGARYYAPWLGVWTSADPAHGTQMTSPYGYASANPVSRVDPDGRDDSQAKPAPSRWRTTVPPPPGSPPGSPEVSIYNEELMARLRKASRAGQLAGAEYGEALAIADEALSNKGFFRFEELKKRGPKGAAEAAKLEAAVRADLDKAIAKFPQFEDPQEQQSAAAAFKWSSGQAFEEAKLALGARRIAFDILMIAGGAALERASLLLIQAAARRLVGPMLRAATVEAATAAMAAGRPVGPVVAGVTDLRTGKSFFALNATGLPKNLHPVLKARVEALEGAAQHFSTPGTHAEVHALNDALWARTNAGLKVTDKTLGEFILDTAWLKGSGRGRMVPLEPAPRCGNCTPITDGVINMAGDAPPKPPAKKP